LALSREQGHFVSVIGQCRVAIDLGPQSHNRRVAEDVPDPAQFVLHAVEELIALCEWRVSLRQGQAD
jgi:hypothetical protein